MPGIRARTIVIVGALVVSAALTAPVLLAQSTTPTAAGSAPSIADAKVLNTIGRLQAVVQAETARATGYRGAAATYAQRAARYASAAPTATAANAQRVRIQNEQRAIAAAGEQLAHRADAAAASASLRSTQLQQQAALAHTP